MLDDVMLSWTPSRWGPPFWDIHFDCFLPSEDARLGPIYLLSGGRVICPGDFSTALELVGSESFVELSLSHWGIPA
jgi:hypothetical protein